MPPELPRQLLGREALVEEIANVILTQDNAVMTGRSPKANANIREPGGYGKTILAQLVARNQKVLDRYAGEVYWLEIGPDAKFADKLLPLIEEITGERPAPGQTPAQLTTSLLNFMRQDKIETLLVIDNVWTEADAKHIQALNDPNICRVLVTTRKQSVADALESTSIDVGLLTNDEAAELIWLNATDGQKPMPEDYQDQVKPLLEIVGGLPLVATILGRQLRKHKTVQAVMDRWNAMHDAELDQAIKKAKGAKDTYDMLGDARETILRTVALALADVREREPGRDWDKFATLLGLMPLGVPLVDTALKEELAKPIADQHEFAFDDWISALKDVGLIQEQTDQSWNNRPTEPRRTWAIHNATQAALKMLSPDPWLSNHDEVYWYTLQESCLQWKQVSELIYWQSAAKLGFESSQKQFGPRARRMQSVFLNELGDVENQRGKLFEALEHYRKSLRLAEVLFTELGTSESKLDLSISMNKVADILFAQKKNSEALDLYRQSLKLAEPLAAELGTPRSKRDWSFSLQKVADVLFAQGKNEEPLSLYWKSHDLCKELAAEPGTPESKSDLSVLKEKIANCLIQKGDKAGALGLIKQSWDLRKALAQELVTPSSLRGVYASCVNMAIFATTAEDLEHWIAEADAALDKYRDFELLYKPDAEWWPDFKARLRAKLAGTEGGDGPGGSGGGANSGDGNTGSG